jgi:hypothetical protein
VFQALEVPTPTLKAHMGAMGYQVCTLKRVEARCYISLMRHCPVLHMKSLSVSCSNPLTVEYIGHPEKVKTLVIKRNKWIKLKQFILNHYLTPYIFFLHDPCEDSDTCIV